MAQLARANPVHSFVGTAESGVSGRRVVVADRPDSLAAARAASRRRQVLTGLTASTTVWLVTAQLVGGLVWGLFGLSAVLLGIYLTLLAQRWIRVSREEATPLVRPPDPPLDFGQRPGDVVIPGGSPLHGDYAAPRGRAVTAHQDLAGDYAVLAWGEPPSDTEAVRVVEW